MKSSIDHKSKSLYRNWKPSTSIKFYEFFKRIPRSGVTNRLIVIISDMLNTNREQRHCFRPEIASSAPRVRVLIVESSSRPLDRRPKEIFRSSTSTHLHESTAKICVCVISSRSSYFSLLLPHECIFGYLYTLSPPPYGLDRRLSRF